MAEGCPTGRHPAPHPTWYPVSWQEPGKSCSRTEQYDSGGISTAPLFGRDLKKCMKLKRVYLQCNLFLLHRCSMQILSRILEHVIKLSWSGMPIFALILIPP